MLENPIMEIIWAKNMIQTGIPMIKTLAAVCPLMGLLGTVTGMIDTFRVITLFGTGDPKLMSGGISEALVTTELGLAVAIPIMLLHTVLARRAEHVVGDMEKQTASAIRRLQARGLRTVMLTGDARVAAEAVAADVGIDDVVADLMPEDKAEHVAALQARGEVVAMVGDGINDAPVLARSDVGFALGSGTDVAIESADITLMGNSLHAVADAIEISTATVRNIWQNLFGAFIYNSLGIPVAAGILYPFSGMLLNPMIAGAAMALSSVTVVSNANRLRRMKPGGEAAG